MDLKQRRQQLQQLTQNLEVANQQIRREKSALRECTIRLTDEMHSQDIIQKVAQGVQQKAHVRITSVVSKCLAIVFPDPYEFVIDFVRKRGKTEAVLRFQRNDLKVHPLKAAGGGVVDVAAFALRLACMSLQEPKVRHFVALDEPFKHVSADNQDRIKEMLEMLSSEMGFQFLFATHEDELQCGKVIHLRKK